MRSVALAALLLALAVTRVAGGPVEAPSSTGVRPLDREMAALLEDALRRSPLVRSEVQIIDASNLIVYLSTRFRANAREPRAKLWFLSAGSGTRYVMVCLDRRNLSWNDRVVLLAHELQHAVEIAGAPEVSDAASFRALFRRIGWERRTGLFETDAARRAAVQARGEVQ